MKTKKKLLIVFLVVGIAMTSFYFGYVSNEIGKNILTNQKYSELDEIKDTLEKYHYSLPEEDELISGAINGMVSSLGDPYTYYFEYNPASISDGESYLGIGISIIIGDGQVVINRVFDNSPASLANIEVGDILLEVEGQAVSELSLSEITSLLKGKPNETRVLRLKRGSSTYSVTLKISFIKTPTITYKMIDDIGYIKINEFSTQTATLFATALESLESEHITGLIIDVRDNPGGLLTSVNDILRMFLVGTKPFLYMEEVASETITPYRPYGTTVKKDYDIKVLINENSASAAEVFALAMNRVMDYELIGKKTFGKGVYQVDVKMKTVEGMYMHITLGYWYGLDKESIHKEGIAPTTEVSLPDYYNVTNPKDDNYSFDDVDSEIANIGLMLTALGYDVRTDGYFDTNMENVLNANYSSTTLTSAIIRQIYKDYLVEIAKPIHDAQLNYALGDFSD